MRSSPRATRPEMGPSSSMKNVMAKTNSAIGKRMAPVPKLLTSAPDMVRVTIAVEGLTSAMKSATASTAMMTPTMSFLVESQLDSTAAAWLARRAGTFLDLCAFDAVFDLRFWAMDP